MTSTEQTGIGFAAAFNGEATKSRDMATRSIAGVPVSDTPLISRAIESRVCTPNPTSSIT